MPSSRFSSSLCQALARDGFTVVAVGDGAVQATVNPWRFVSELLGEVPLMVERQPIRAVEGGRSFASTRVFTPLHTDSQLYLGAPPDVQVMVCERPASDGGASLLADAWRLCETIEARNPSLFHALLHTHRRIPFVFGDVYGPTLAIRGNALAFTHSPIAPDDPVGRALVPFVEAAAHDVVLRRGEALVLDNRSVLHGRRAFADTGRSFVRLLVWLAAPLRPHVRFQSLAETVALRTRAVLDGAPEAVRARFGLPSRRIPTLQHKLRAVLEVLCGGAPGAIAARERIPEVELYAWRDVALLAAAEALDALATPDDLAGDLDRALRRLA